VRARARLLDVGGHHHRLDLSESPPALLTPGEELSDGLRVGEPGVRVSDVNGEELQKARAGPPALAGDDGRKVGSISHLPICDYDLLFSHTLSIPKGLRLWIQLVDQTGAEA
jgi:hypothetical protein